MHNLPLVKSCLTVFNCFSVSQMFSLVFQGDLLHGLSKHEGEAGQGVDPMVLVFTLFKTACNVSFSSVTGDFA